METEKLTKLVIEIPMEVYFRLREKAGGLTVKQYIELLLRNVGRIRLRDRGG